MVAELVALSPQGREFRGSGVLEGTVALQRRGDGGFGYDPIFVPGGEDRTVAELGDGWKVEHSHRGQAARALAKAIAQGEPLAGVG
jgi:XTP/dITP diphosphohydrolase